MHTITSHRVRFFRALSLRIGGAGGLFLLWFGLMVCPVSQAQVSWRTQFQLRKAKRAMALGMLKRWKQALKSAEATFAKEASRMPLQQRNNAQMWIWFLWSKYYQFLGEYPPVLSIQKFDDKAALQRYIQLFRKAVKSLEQGRTYLKRYNGLFAQIMERSRWRNQIYLQASLSLLRDVEGELRSGRMYISFLEYAHHNWGNMPKIQKQLKQMRGMVERLDQNAAEAKVKALLEKRKRRRLARVMIETQRKYIHTLRDLHRQKRVARGLVIGGSVGVAVGGVVIAVATYLLVSANSSGGGTVSEKQLNQNIGWSLAVPGIVVASVGAGLLITGLVIQPSQAALDHATIRTHNAHIDVERKERQEQQKDTARPPVSLYRPPTANQPPPPSCTQADCVTLGRW